MTVARWRSPPAGTPGSTPAARSAPPRARRTSSPDPSRWRPSSRPARRGGWAAAPRPTRGPHPRGGVGAARGGGASPPGPEPLETVEPPSPPRRVVRRPRPDRRATGPEVARPAEPKPAGRWRWGARIALVAVLAAVAAAGLLGRQWDDQRQLDTGRQQAPAAARQETGPFVSIGSPSADR